MESLKFEYLDIKPSEELKKSFEVEINERLSHLTEYINLKNGYVLVSWKIEPTKLRGLIIMDA